ncbi:MAG: 4-hydroxythreonine-4-phosphate dehydrogenase PdxA [Nitrospirae bacterium]|nr:4-hydroxythreonine-4-phosphate dehydrogenase PdxA [Candidatus Troglogloeales bacterium]
MMKPIIAITMGDPYGIGPEVIVKAFETEGLYAVCRPVVIGVSEWMKKAASLFAPALSICPRNAIAQCRFLHGQLEVLEIATGGLPPIIYGVPADTGLMAATQAIEEAAQLAIAKKVDAIATAPINKEALKKIGFAHPGHTEFLAHIARCTHFGMMMVGGGLKIMLATIHLSLSEAILMTRKGLILEKIRLTHQALKSDFGLPDGKIAVAALNPHAGEGGLFGEEEIKEIHPAVLSAQAEGINVSGPYPADTLFYKLKQGRFDAVVALYHDQALIPIKLLAFGNGVNVTVGLPFIRTSVDHGTAYDIAGKGIADAGSIIEAVKLAAQMASSRKRFMK